MPLAVTTLGVAVSVVGLGRGLRWYRGRAQVRQQAGLRARERQILTRELHDVVNHHLSTAALQVMGYLDASDADELRSILAKVNLSVKAALAELRQLARLEPDGSMSAGDAVNDLTVRVPPADVADLWAGRLTDAGFTVTVAIPRSSESERLSVLSTVSDAIEVACDNILRHAPRRSACSVTLEKRRDQLVVRVRSPLPSGSLVAGQGQSLRRLRVRVDLSGGTLWAGPFPAADGSDAFWLVQVTVPL